MATSDHAESAGGADRGDATDAERAAGSDRDVPSRAAVGVVGGGISGLVTLHYLRRAGVDAVGFEATERPGGVIRSDLVDGHVVDYGPQRTRYTGPVADLVADLDLEDRVVEAADRPLYVYHDGDLKRAPLSLGAAIRTDLLSWRGKLRVLAEPLTGPARPGESVADFLERKFGREAARRAIAPVYSGLYGSDPESMPVQHSLGQAIEKAGIEGSLLVGVARKLLERRLGGGERPPPVTFEGGMVTLPRVLADVHADRLFLGTPVEGIWRVEDDTGRRDAGADPPRFGVETPRGTTVVDRLVATTPAPVTADLLDGIAPGAAERIGGLSYNPMAVVHLRAALDREGAGFLVAGAAGDEMATMGTTWNASLFDRDGVYTCYLGGSDRPGIVEESDGSLGRVAAREFETVTGRPADVLSVGRLPRGMPAYDDTWDALSTLDLPAGVDLCASFAARAGIPGRIAEARQTARRLAGESG